MSTISSTRGEIYEQEGEFGQFAEFSWKYLFKVPKLRYPSDANSRQRQRKFELFNPSQAKPEEWLEKQHRQGAEVQSYPSNYITTPVALVQHCSGRAAAAAGRLRSISLVCRLRDTITLHLAAVRLPVRFTQGHLSGQGPTQGQLPITCTFARSE